MVTCSMKCELLVSSHLVRIHLLYLIWNSTFGRFIVKKTAKKYKGRSLGDLWVAKYYRPLPPTALLFMNNSFLPKLSDRLACINEHWPTPSFKRIDEYEVQVFRIRLHFALFIIPTKIGNNDLREINYALPFVVKHYCYAPMTTQKDKSTGK